MLINLLSIWMMGRRHGVQVREVKIPHVDCSVFFFSTRWVEDTTRMLTADVVWECTCACTREVHERCREGTFHKEWREGGGVRFLRLFHFWAFGNPPCSGDLSPLSWGAVLLERVCVSLCVRVPGAMRFHRVGLSLSKALSW